MKCENCPLVAEHWSAYCEDCDISCLVTGEYISYDESGCTRTNKWILSQDPEKLKEKRLQEEADMWNEFADQLEEKGGTEMTIKDSGTRRQFDSGAVRDMQEGKGRCDLLPACAILRVARHFEAGAKKYDDRNWEKGIPVGSFIDSAIRHLMKYLDGQVDEDHLCAAGWNILCAMWTEEKRPDLINIPTRPECEIDSE